MKGKIDVGKIVKKMSRDMFMGMDTRTKTVPSKRQYKRNTKHKNINY